MALSAVVFLLSIMIACNKDLSLSDGRTEPPIDLATTATVNNVAGFVTDENGNPAAGVPVTLQNTTITTDKYGYFQFQQLKVVRDAAMLSVEKAGYFKAFKTFMATEGKGAFFRIQLMPKLMAGSFESATGGTVGLNNGVSVTLPPISVVEAISGKAYSGKVNVSAYWINPLDPSVDRVIPGDLRGLTTTMNMRVLTSYGMAAVELTGTSGQLLQLKTGSKAQLVMPIPATQLASAPASIPLWHLDEKKGLWIEEGAAMKEGSVYKGEVSHFSYWNCDKPSSFVNFSCQLLNQQGEPLRNVMVKISRMGNSNGVGYGYTDTSGFTSGAIPAQEQLMMQVFANGSCANPIYARALNTNTNSIALGSITVNTANVEATITGNLTDCNLNQVSSGYIILKTDEFTHRVPVMNGHFKFSTQFCGLPAQVTLIAEDLKAMQQSSALSFNLQPGNNALGNVQACGNTTQEYMTYSINGQNYAYTYPTDTLATGRDNSLYHLYTFNRSFNSGVNMAFNLTGIAQGSSQQLNHFLPTQITDTLKILTPIQVKITEYGAIGQFIGGNFTGSFTGNAPANKTYNVTCSFRYRRI